MLVLTKILPSVGQNGHDAAFKLLSDQALMLQIFLNVSVHPELLVKCRSVEEGSEKIDGTAGAATISVVAGGGDIFLC